MALQKYQLGLTIFTPTYNRAHTLSKLYASLKKQTCIEFEWLVVDDGSIDGTSQLFKQWTEEGIINITYIKKENGGKHRAINLAALRAKGELFFIVDSDDFIVENAVESILEKWNNITDKSKMAGLCFRKVNNKTGLIMGKEFPCPLSTTSLAIHYNLRIHCDKAEVFLTDLLCKFPFPEIEGEKFLSEAFVWNKIAISETPLLLCVNQGIYICEYLEDGLTKNFIKLMKANPKGFILYYSSLLRLSCVWNHPIDVIKVLTRLFQGIVYLIFK